jgi:hypothetical protein
MPQGEATYGHFTAVPIVLVTILFIRRRAGQPCWRLQINEPALHPPDMGAAHS